MSKKKKYTPDKLPFNTSRCEGRIGAYLVCDKRETCVRYQAIKADAAKVSIFRVPIVPMMCEPLKNIYPFYM
jgi:hypothetical protein